MKPLAIAWDGELTWVTFALTSQQAEMVRAAEKRGELRLWGMPNPNDWAGGRPE
jgi:hypothetical protein